MVYFSQLTNRCIFDNNNECLGKLIDLVFLDGKNYAQITYLVYRDENNYKKKIAWSFVKEFKEGTNEKDDKLCIYLNSSIDEVTPFFLKQKESLVGDILDKQVIDVNGVKVVRVNDLILGKVDNMFCIVAVCVGATSFVRRLGIPKLSGLASTGIKDHVIPWKSVERLEPAFHDLHLKVQRDKIEDLHPEDIADIMEDVSPSERILIFNSLDERKAAKTLLKSEKGIRGHVLKSFKLKKIMDLLENIPTDHAADIISLMPVKRGEDILNAMDKKVAAKIRKILNYFPKSVGSLMKTEFISVPTNNTARQTINSLRKTNPPSGTAYHIYVVDKDKHLIGVLPVRALLIANPASKVEEIMNKRVIYVRDHSSKETAARLMARYDLFVLPVVDKDNILRGLIKSDDVLNEYIPERLKRQKFLPLSIRHRQNGSHKQN